MNWKSSIKAILGTFWSRMFKDRDFLQTVENLESLYGTAQEKTLDNWTEERIQASDTLSPDRLPYVIDLDVASFHHKYAAISDITSGTKTFGQESSDNEWMTDDVSGLECPDWITDHVKDHTLVLLKDIDYRFADGRLSLYKNPRTMGLPVVKYNDEDGNLHVYYRLFGWKGKDSLNNDAVTGFISPDLASHAARAWDIHVNGASVLSMSRLLAEVSGSVVAEADGSVQDIWTEQNTRYMLAGDRLYAAPVSTSCNKVTGDSVNTGDVLFGDLRVYSGSGTPSATEVPGIRVMTDVGELTATNASLSSIYDSSTGYYYLPLQGDQATVNAYIARCKEIAADPHSLFCDIPSVVNPFLFVKNTLRRRRGCFVTLTADTIQDLEPALDCIRKGTSCSAVVTVFMRAKGETMSAAVSGFTAEAGNAAVSEYATIKLVSDSAEATRLT